MHLFKTGKYILTPLNNFTTDSSVLCDLGRFLLFINSVARSIQYWFRLIKQLLTGTLKKVYKMLYGMLERDCASRNWVAQIKFLLCYNGFGYVWMYGCMGHEKMFITKLKNWLRDCCCQRWFSHLAKREWFDLCSCFKNILEREKYLEVVQSSVQNCTTWLLYGHFVYEWSQASLLSSIESTILPFLCRHNWWMPCAFQMPSVQSVKRQVPHAFIQRLTWERTLLRIMQGFGW